MKPRSCKNGPGFFFDTWPSLVAAPNPDNFMNVIYLVLFINKNNIQQEVDSLTASNRMVIISTEATRSGKIFVPS